MSKPLKCGPCNKCKRKSEMMSWTPKVSQQFANEVKENQTEANKEITGPVEMKIEQREAMHSIRTAKGDKQFSKKNDESNWVWSETSDTFAI
ncbi:hypothetical protein DPMN_127086 [Dreissena polymorpha]|uniref:Uncharacterized protein n=1 Tax=Dreissena polymorpha TaxID=45954 RepID=A0A9D4H4K8_DREPO|nr:hypothetical protein DPMN_127086 [Dreissena polymorpha]